MQDPWKYLAFPAAAVAGFIVSDTAIKAIISGQLGLSSNVSQILVIGLTGLVAGFLVDEVIPAYIEKVRGNQGAGDLGGGDFGGGDDDFDFE